MKLPTKDRLDSLQVRGLLRRSELARWLGAPMATVATWIKLGREPSYPRSLEIERRIKLLEAAISEYRMFPIPPTVKFNERNLYVAKCFAECNNRVPKDVAAE